MKKHLIILLILLCACLAGCATASENETFLYISDTQADEETGDYGIFAQTLAQAVDGQDIDFILHGGDAVNDGLDESEWADFFAAYNSAAVDIPLYRTHGNHDDYSWPQQYGAESNSGPRDGFYSVEQGNVHVTVMNSNYMGMDDTELADWLCDDLAAAQGWKVVVFHHPFYPSLDVSKDAERAAVQRELWLQLFEQGGVDVVLNGHQHLYLRTEPLLAGQPAKGGVIYLMVASGSKPNYALSPPPEAAVCFSGISYTVFEASDASLSATSYNGDGQVIDQFIINK